MQYHKEIMTIIITSFLFFIINILIISSPPLFLNNNIIVEQGLSTRSFISKNKNHKIYYQGDFSELKYGNVLKINSMHCTQPKNFYNNPTSFNYVNYLLGKKIRLTCQVKDYRVTNQIRSLKNLILNWRTNLLKKLSTSNNGSAILISSLILGSKNENYSDFFSTSGTSHLFVISGTHVAVLIIFLNLISNIFCSTYLQKQLLITVLLLSFSILCGLNIPVLRTVLIFLLNLWFPNKNWFLIIFTFSLFLNPFLFLNNSFVLSFFVSFYIITFLKIDQHFNFRSYFRQNLELWIITIPFQLLFNNSLNLLSPILNLFLGPAFSFIILPLSIISFIFPIKLFLVLLNLIFKLLIHMITAFNCLNLHLNNFNQIEFVIYYLLFFFSKLKIYPLKIFITFLICLFTISFIPNHDYAIYALDSKNIDSTLIQTNNQENILINTGDNKFPKELSKFLKSKSIYTIDYLILTNNVEQQLNNIKFLEQYFKITTIITPDNISKSSLPLYLNYQKVGNTLNLKYQNHNTDYYFLNTKLKQINPQSHNVFFSNNKNNIPSCHDCFKVITPETFELDNKNYYFPEKNGLLKVKLQ